MKIYPYMNGSASAKALSAALGCILFKREGRPRVTDILINWGCSEIRREIKWTKKCLNLPAAVRRASNKLITFTSLQGEVPIPEWTDKAEVAQEWYKNGDVVVARSVLNGHSGEGIVLIHRTTHEEWDEKHYPLYTKYIPKQHEYRLHTSAEHGVFFIQRKARKKDIADDQVNWKIRNHSNGFIFAHQDVDVSEAMKDACVKACVKLGLNFAAFDVIQKKNGEFFILEANTACGLEGTTLEKYVEMFKKYEV